jgi:hypothetical protein
MVWQARRASLPLSWTTMSSGIVCRAYEAMTWRRNVPRLNEIMKSGRRLDTAESLGFAVRFLAGALRMGRGFIAWRLRGP